MLLAVFLVLVLVVPNATAQTAVSGRLWSGLYSVTNDVRNENYVDGDLGWSDGSGSIAWGSAEDGSVAAPGYPANEVSAWAGWTLAMNTGGAVGEDLIPSVTFESEPFPQDIYVDVGRVMQVNLMMQLPSCSIHTNENRFSLEARINGEIWGGMPTGLMGDIGPAETDPKAPAGWCLVPFRFHSEFDVIEAGDTLSLTVFYHHDNLEDMTQAPTIGFGPDHPSTLHVPFYPLDEAALRRPEYQGSGAAPVLAGLGGGAALAVLMVPKGRRRGLLALLVVAPLLAGCASSPEGPAESPEDSRGSQEYTIERKQDGSNATDFGTIVGLVHDPLAVPVVGAHVALLGTDFFAQSDKRGKFVFEDLPEGSYHYRVDHADHRSFEAEVAVEADAVTRVDILLPYADNRTGDALLHRHNLWPPDGKKVLFDETIAEDVVCHNTNELPIVGSFWNRHCELPVVLPLVPAGEDPFMIYPGTQRVEVTVTWDGGTVQRAGFFFVPNGEVDPYDVFDRVNRTVMWPRESGEVTNIPVPWEMADVGHQQWTVWEMGVWIPLEVGTSRGGLPEYRAVTMEGPIHVKMEIFKGVVPLEPAHKDHWKGQDSLVVIDAETTTYGVEPSGFIPPETRWLEITLERDRRTLGQNEELFYTAADSPWAYSQRVMRQVVFPDPEALKQQVNWPLIDGEADPPYASKSYWDFDFIRPGDINDPENRLAYADETALGQVVFTLTVVAHRTEVPSDAAERSD